MKTGFTLIEVAITIGILTMLFGIGLAITYDAYRSQVLTAERDNLVIILQRARSEALANINEADHGVHIGSTQYTIFQGDSYSDRNQTSDENFPRTGGLTLNGASDIVFRSPDAFVTSTGTIAFSNGISALSISINSEGGIDW